MNLEQLVVTWKGRQLVLALFVSKQVGSGPSPQSRLYFKDF